MDMDKFETEELDPVIKKSVELLIGTLQPREALEKEDILVTLWTSWFQGKISQALKECISDRFENTEFEITED